MAMVTVVLGASSSGCVAQVN